MDLLLAVIRINFRARPPCNLVVMGRFRVHHDANDFEPGMLLRLWVFRVAHAETFANRISAREVPLHSLFIDEGYRLRRLYIGVREVSTSDGGNAHCPKIARPSRYWNCLRQMLAGEIPSAIDLERLCSSIRQSEKESHSCGIHAGERPQPVRQTIRKLSKLSVRTVPPVRQRELDDMGISRVESKRLRIQAEKGRQQQRRPDQQDDRKCNLCPHNDAPCTQLARSGRSTK